MYGNLEQTEFFWKISLLTIDFFNLMKNFSIKVHCAVTFVNYSTTDKIIIFLFFIL